MSTENGNNNACPDGTLAGSESGGNVSPINPELNEAATTAVGYDELVPLPNVYGDSTYWQGFGGGFRSDTYNGSFLVPTLQINKSVSSGFREKVIINQELFYNGDVYNNLPFFEIAGDNNQQSYYYHSEFAPNDIARAQMGTILKYFSMLPPVAAEKIQTQVTSRRIDRLRFVSCKWWTFHPNEERFVKLDNEAEIQENNVIDLLPLRRAIHPQPGTVIPQEIITEGFSLDASGMLGSRQHQASTICAHKISFRRASNFNGPRRGYDDEITVTLDENNPTVSILMEEMVENFGDRFPGLALVDNEGNITPNKASCLRYINDAYFFGSKSIDVFGPASPSATNPELSDFVQTRLGTKEKPVFEFTDPMQGRGALDEKPGETATQIRVSRQYEDLVHSIEMPFFPSETGKLNYTQYTSVDVKYQTLRTGAEEDILNSPLDEANNNFSARQRNVYREYYSSLLNRENINQNILPSTIRYTPEELINLNENALWIQGRFQDWDELPTYGPPVDPDINPAAEQLLQRPEAPAGSKLDYDGAPVNTEVEDCESLEDDRLLFFTGDNVKQLQSINDQMKNNYEYYISVNIRTQQGTAVANLLHETGMDKYMLLAYTRSLTTINQAGRQIKGSTSPGNQQSIWWHEKLVTEILDQQVTDSQFRTGPNDKFVENIKQKFIDFRLHMDAINLDTMISGQAGLGKYLKYFPLRFEGSEDLTTNAFFDMINLVSFNNRLDEFISPARIIEHDGQPILADADDQSFDMTGDIRRHGKIRNFKDILLGKRAYSETIAYRIDKHDYNFAGQINREPLQTFILCDSDEIKEIELLDNQVIYGKEYCYKIYAVNFVLGSKYVYTAAGPTDGTTESKLALANNEIRMRVHTSPAMYLVETPYFIKNVSTVDKPPVFPSVSFIPLKGVDNRIGIDLTENTGIYRLSPVVIRDSDARIMMAQLAAAEASDDFKITYKDDSPLTNFEIFRLDRPPKNYRDFNNGSYREYYPRSGGASDSVISPQSMEELPKIIPGRGIMFFDTISPNTDYYYTFRARDNAGLSVPTSVFKIRMVSYENGTYLDVDTYEFPKLKPKSFFFQRVMEIAPALEQKIFNIPFEGSLEKAYQTVPNNTIELGIKEDKVWNKNFKFRISSCHTARKIDLNIKFTQKTLIEKEQDEEKKPCPEVEDEYTPSGHIDGRTIPCPPGHVRDFDTGACVRRAPIPEEDPPVVDLDLDDIGDAPVVKPEPKPIPDPDPVVEDTVLIIDPCYLFGADHQSSRAAVRMGGVSRYGGLVDNPNEVIGQDQALMREALIELQYTDADAPFNLSSPGATQQMFQEIGQQTLYSTQAYLRAQSQASSMAPGRFSPPGAENTNLHGVFEIPVADLIDYETNPFPTVCPDQDSNNFGSATGKKYECDLNDISRAVTKSDLPTKLRAAGTQSSFFRAKFYYVFVKQYSDRIENAVSATTAEIEESYHNNIISKLCDIPPPPKPSTEEVQPDPPKDPPPPPPKAITVALTDPCTGEGQGSLIFTDLGQQLELINDDNGVQLAVLSLETDTTGDVNLRPRDRALIEFYNLMITPDIVEARGIPPSLPTEFRMIELNFCNQKIARDEEETPAATVDPGSITVDKFGRIVPADDPGETTNKVEESGSALDLPGLGAANITPAMLQWAEENLDGDGNLLEDEEDEEDEEESSSDGGRGANLFGGSGPRRDLSGLVGNRDVTDFADFGTDSRSDGDTVDAVSGTRDAGLFSGVNLAGDNNGSSLDVLNANVNTMATTPATPATPAVDAITEDINGRESHHVLKDYFYHAANNVYWQWYHNLINYWTSIEWNGIVETDIWAATRNTFGPRDDQDNGRHSSNVDPVITQPWWFRRPLIRFRNPNRQYAPGEYDERHVIYPGCLCDALVWQILKYEIINLFLGITHAYTDRLPTIGTTGAAAPRKLFGYNSASGRIDAELLEGSEGYNHIKEKALGYAALLMNMNSLGPNLRNILSRFGEPKEDVRSIDGGAGSWWNRTLTAFGTGGRNSSLAKGTFGSSFLFTRGAWTIAPSFIKTGDSLGFRDEYLDLQNSRQMVKMTKIHHYLRTVDGHPRPNSVPTPGTDGPGKHDNFARDRQNVDYPWGNGGFDKFFNNMPTPHIHIGRIFTACPNQTNSVYSILGPHDVPAPHVASAGLNRNLNATPMQDYMTWDKMPAMMYLSQGSVDARHSVTHSSYWDRYPDLSGTDPGGGPKTHSCRHTLGDMANLMIDSYWLSFQLDREVRGFRLAESVPEVSIDGKSNLYIKAGEGYLSSRLQS